MKKLFFVLFLTIGMPVLPADNSDDDDYPRRASMTSSLRSDLDAGSFVHSESDEGITPEGDQDAAMPNFAQDSQEAKLKDMAIAQKQAESPLFERVAQKYSKFYNKSIEGIESDEPMEIKKATAENDLRNRLHFMSQLSDNDLKNTENDLDEDEILQQRAKNPLFDRVAQKYTTWYQNALEKVEPESDEIADEQAANNFRRHLYNLSQSSDQDLRDAEQDLDTAQSLHEGHDFTE
ncbi:hypothetical protein A3J41_00855 [candidate division TM6 bacterium RIFCSPHIGHO2_12_FULL_38_8]|nr:MAG: hypothetical protein A3J41_00855 [candidate division TM6 bacterium RIFCSPHIGHO2_12_FULL_38_8]